MWIWPKGLLLLVLVLVLAYWSPTSSSSRGRELRKEVWLAFTA
jgi:hypothetical protein